MNFEPLNPSFMHPDLERYDHSIYQLNLEHIVGWHKKEHARFFNFVGSQQLSSRGILRGDFLMKLCMWQSYITLRHFRRHHQLLPKWTTISPTEPLFQAKNSNIVSETHTLVRQGSHGVNTTSKCFETACKNHKWFPCLHGRREKDSQRCMVRESPDFGSF